MYSPFMSLGSQEHTRQNYSDSIPTKCLSTWHVLKIDCLPSQPGNHTFLETSFIQYFNFMDFSIISLTN